MENPERRKGQGRKPSGPGKSRGCRLFYAWAISQQMSHTEIGRRLNCPLATVSRYMRGKRPPGAKAAAKIKELTGIEPDAWGQR